MQISISQVLSKAWEIEKKNLSFVIILAIIAFGINAAPGILAGFLTNAGIEFPVFLIRIIGWVVSVLVAVGLITISLKLVDGKTAKYSELYEHYNQMLPYLGLTIVYSLIILGGVMLFIVPGIIWAIKYQFCYFAMLEKKLPVMESLRYSGKITQGHKWQLFLLDIVLGLLNIAGSLLFGLGLLITVPLGMITMAIIYRKLAK